MAFKGFVIWAVGENFFGDEAAVISRCDLKTIDGANRRAERLLGDPRSYGCIKYEGLAQFEEKMEKARYEVMRDTAVEPVIAF